MKNAHRIGIVVSALAVMAVGAVEIAAATENAARVELRGREGSQLSGVVTFSEMGDHVMLVAEVENAPPGVHGFHLHEKGDCSAADFTSAGGHFNPGEAEHGGPDAEMHHAGDFGNITIGDDGKGRLEMHTSMISVADGARSVMGRAVILHDQADDMTTQPTGAAGGRIACGVVK